MISALSGLGRPTVAQDRNTLLNQISRAAWRAVVLPIEDEADLKLLPRIAEALPQALLVATHPSPTVDLVLEAEAAGAVLLSHPPDPGRLRALLQPYLSEDADHPVPACTADGTEEEDRVVGTSPALAEAYRTVARVAASTAPVLIEGESGTGKELVARALHRRSARAARPFVAVNCAALPEGLLEAELFGYERGAFTGAVGRSEGRFGRADGGTLFLDEIGEMGPTLQAKLLRALESGEIDRLGSGGTVRVDVRVVAATNRSLDERVRAGAFREDLLYRLAVVRVRLPPLRARMEDLLPLTEAFVAHFARRHAREVRAISSQAIEALRRRSWPGNIRELRNVLDRAVLSARGGVLRTVDLGAADHAPTLSPLETGRGLEGPSRWTVGQDGSGDEDRGDEDRGGQGSTGSAGYPATLSLREVEERHIRRVLVATYGHLGDAARILGIHRNTMTVKVREYGIDPIDPHGPEPATHGAGGGHGPSRESSNQGGELP